MSGSRRSGRSAGIQGWQLVSLLVSEECIAGGPWSGLSLSGMYVLGLVECCCFGTKSVRVC